MQLQDPPVTVNKDDSIQLSGAGTGITAKVYGGCGGDLSSTETNAQIKVPRNGTLKNVFWVFNAGAATTGRLAIRLNAADIASTVLTLQTTGQLSTTGLSVNLTAGDLLCFSAERDGGINSVDVRGVTLGVTW